MTGQDHAPDEREQRDERDELAELRAAVAAQAAALAELRALLVPPTATPARTAATGSGPSEQSEVGPGAEVPGGEVPPGVDRRSLLRRAGAAAGLAVAGGAALTVGSATPAAAATVEGSGAPGIRALGVGGDGIDTTTNSFGLSAVFAHTTAAGAIPITATYTHPSHAGYAILGQAPAFEGNFGVVGYGFEGVKGQSMHTGSTFGAVGVHGVDAANGYGVWGQGANGVGVLGAAENGTGVEASGTFGVRTGGTTAPLWITSQGAAPTTQPDAKWYRGQFVVDDTGTLWFCTKDWPNATWIKLGGQATAGQLHVLPSTRRVYDSRPGEAPASSEKGVLANGGERVINTNLSGTTIPAGGASAVLVNVTVTSTTNSGFVALYKNGIPYPLTSTVNWSTPGTTIANLAVVAVQQGAGTGLNLRAKVALACSAHLIVDLIGYYR